MITDFKNKYPHGLCYILGSGPSIKKQNLLKLSNRTTFCTNWFINHNQFSKLNIDFYCAYDTNFIHPAPNPEWQNVLENYAMYKFFPLQWQSYGLPFENCIYVKFDPSVKIYQSNRFSVDPAAGFYDGDTVVINLCIPLAIYMGFKEIILLGFDCNYYTKNNSAANAYFYNIKDHKTLFDSDEKRNVQWQQNVMQACKAVKKFADKHQITILNATAGGDLEIFDRISFEKTLS